MSDKPVAGFVTFAIIAPIMVLCCAALTAPLLVGSFVATITSWIGGLDSFAAILIGLFSALAIFGFLRSRKRHTSTASLAKEVRK